MSDYIKLPVANAGRVSDGYHTFDELYEFRLLYNAALFNEWAKLPGNPYNVHKSQRHADAPNDHIFGGGWFIVTALLPTGQISNHYELKDWGLFQVPVQQVADRFDGHTPADVAERLRGMIEQKRTRRIKANDVN
jgi:hypothetical protein